MGPIIIASLLKQEGHTVEVLSEYVTKLKIEEINKADLVGISITTYNARRGYDIARRVKKPIVFGGFHASLLPEECLKYGDYVIKGDGHSIVGLAAYLDHKGTADIGQISNLVYKNGEKNLYNPNVTKAINVVPDFGLVKDYYRNNLNRLLRIPLLTNASRGCHCDCTFCSIKAIYPDIKKKDKKILIKDIQNQINNQPWLSKFLPRIIWITDDNFFSDKNWAKDVLRDLSKIKTRFKFVIQARPDIATDDELLNLLKDANIGIVYMGIESLNQKSLDNLNKDLSVSDIEFAIKKIRNIGINVHGLFVFGDDEFRTGDGLKIAKFAKKLKLSGILIQPLIPFPGTKLHQKLKEEGRLLHEDWQHYNGKVVFEPKNMTAADLQREISDCYKKVFSPLKIVKFLLKGPKGFKLAGLGEARLRRLEGSKKKNYIKDKLSD
jgi:anaerobic magnesium-protoporphyrin IX monomethyl ester cyclase